MIEFRLNSHSGVPTYLQLVQQVRHAVRLGLLQPGDQLPTVKEVVGGLAINPNTVLKAYRELDHEGLMEGRRGQGTFVSSEPPLAAARRGQGPPVGAAALDRARTCGRARRRQHGGALCRHGSATGLLEGGLSWDEAVALARIEHLGLSLGQKIGKLSGGQQAQVALTLALAKQQGPTRARRADRLARPARPA